jgi:hypothetical protein
LRPASVSEARLNCAQRMFSGGSVYEMLTSRSFA